MSREWLTEFIAKSPPVDVVRDEAARCAEETARYERGERGPLHMPRGLVDGEFSDAAFGVAAEVATAVGDALRATGKRFQPAMVWATAARLLRAGWQRGHRMAAVEIGKGEPS